MDTFASSISGAPLSPMVQANASDLSTLLPLIVPMRSAAFSQEASTTFTDSFLFSRMPLLM